MENIYRASEDIFRTLMVHFHRVQIRVSKFYPQNVIGNVLYKLSLELIFKE